jgi:aspartate/methionine/tyrosine aminotransferase
MRDKLYKTNLRICDMLDKHKVSYSQPSWWLYFFVAVGGDSKIFCQKLLEIYHVSAIPGVYFGREWYIRICYGMDEEIVFKGIEKIISCLWSSTHNSI